MAPILQPMHRRVIEHIPEVKVEFLSYVNDPQCGLYDMSRGTLKVEES